MRRLPPTVFASLPSPRYSYCPCTATLYERSIRSLLPAPFMHYHSVTVAQSSTGREVLRTGNITWSGRLSGLPLKQVHRLDGPPGGDKHEKLKRTCSEVVCANHGGRACGRLRAGWNGNHRHQLSRG